MADHFSLRTYALFILALLAAMLLCVCVGSVSVAPKDTLTAIFCALLGKPAPAGVAKNIIVNVRLPGVMNVALVGASLSLCGAAMQGLLRNPLADGSTLGVSAGASLGAVIALALGVTIPGSDYGGTMLMAMAFAFLSLTLILSLAYALDHSLATNSIILIGVIFSMFVSSVINLILSFVNDQVRSIAFWTMGSLSGTGYPHTRILSLVLLLCGGVIARHARELNAFAIGEDNARHVGVNVRRVKLAVLVTVSVLIGVCVSISGSIGFVGLVVPHAARMIAGPNHRRLLPASMFAGAIFLLLGGSDRADAAQPGGAFHRRGDVAGRRGRVRRHLLSGAEGGVRAMLRAENVTVRYGAQTVVNGLSFELRAGQWLMLVGPNGAGKSTLIEAIAQGVPYTGRISLEGRDIRVLKGAERARSVGFLAQKNAVSYAYSVEEVVSLGRYAHASGFLSARDDEGEACVERALEWTGLTALRRASVLTLSGGELQRTFLAQVFAQNPKLLILDEPANHLDLIYQKHIFSLIEAWLKQPGRAVISVVHDLSLAKKYGTHAVLMDRGRCAAQGKTAEVMTRERLEAVYGMDVYGWMRDLLGQWA